MADFADTLRGAKELKVDVVHLGNVSACLTKLVDAIRGNMPDNVRGTVRTADEALRPGGTAGQSALGSSQFDEAKGLTLRARSTFEAVDANVAAVATSLEKTAKAITEIATRYRSVEQRNHLAAAELAKLLSR
jgi:hypothetical protein